MTMHNLIGKDNSSYIVNIDKIVFTVREDDGSYTILLDSGCKLKTTESEHKKLVEAIEKRAK